MNRNGKSFTFYPGDMVGSGHLGRYSVSTWRSLRKSRSGKVTLSFLPPLKQERKPSSEMTLPLLRGEEPPDLRKTEKSRRILRNRAC